MNKSLRWIGAGIGILLGFFIVAICILYGIGWSRINKRYQVVPDLVQLLNDEGSLLEGKRIFQYRGCEACHGEDLQGLVYLDNPAIGKVITPNLTRGIGGVMDDRSEEDLVLAVRHGISPDGTGLLFMPSTEFYYLSDQDLGAVLAYIWSKSPVDNQPGKSELSPTGFIVMNLTNQITFLPAELISHEKSPPPAPAPGLSSDYGEYLSLSCPVCHGLGMSGGEIPGFPPEWPAASNLTPGPGSRLPLWGVEGFIDIIRDGEKHGRAIHPDYMPWSSYRHMTDAELQAVFLHLTSLEEKEFGQR